MDTPGSGRTLFDDPERALERVAAIYERNAASIREAFEHYAQGHYLDARVRACYPYVSIRTDRPTRVDPRWSYGFVAGPGTYATTLTRPDLYGAYYLKQFKRLLNTHGSGLEVGESSTPIPVHFAFPEGIHVEGGLDSERMADLGAVFDLPDLALMDDSIVNGTYPVRPGAAQPLALFTAPRVDYSLHRLKHYTGTSAGMFQNLVLFTNYQFYVDEFVRFCHEVMSPADCQADLEYRSQYACFVEPGDVTTWNANLELRPPQGNHPERLPQMPAYHLVRDGHSGITLVNIGVGPSNAKTITDHIAVLRPHAWIMLGHCAGLHNTQSIGDYVLAHGYVRGDHVLDAELPPWVPVPALAEVQVALERAVAEISQLDGYELKKIMRTGTVASTDNRNWELREQREPVRGFTQSRAIALDMESATIAANGFRLRVPYGTLLCVSDKPLHGEIKLPGMANQFYRQRVDQHLRIGVRALEILRNHGVDRLHSRKLRSFNEVAFQ